jgi:hypothetical protein
MPLLINILLKMKNLNIYLTFLTLYINCAMGIHIEILDNNIKIAGNQ